MLTPHRDTPAPVSCPEKRFTLHKDVAEDWLRQALDAMADNLCRVPVPPLPAIGPAWSPEDPGEQDTVWELLSYAVQVGAITTPPGVNLDFEFVPTDAGHHFRFRVDTDGQCLTLVSDPPVEMSGLGHRGTTGLDAALAVLAEAVISGNQVLDRLDSYVMAEQHRAGIVGRIRGFAARICAHLAYVIAPVTSLPEADTPYTCPGCQAVCMTGDPGRCLRCGLVSDHPDATTARH